MMPVWLCSGRLLSGSQQQPGQLVLWAARCAREGYARRSKSIVEDIDTRLLPTVAIVGRPNVGKSALFNRLVGKRDALVYDTPRGHVTRDYKEAVAQLGDLNFHVVDTSGLEPTLPSKSLQARATALTAGVLRRTDIALFLLDAKEGVLPADHFLARWLQRTLGSHQPVVVAANKAETREAQKAMVETAAEACRLGLGLPVAMSATSGEGMVDLYQALQPLVDQHVAHARQQLGLPPLEEGSVKSIGGRRGSKGRDGGEIDAEEASLRRWKDSRQQRRLPQKESVVVVDSGNAAAPATSHGTAGAAATAPDGGGGSSIGNAHGSVDNGRHAVPAMLQEALVDKQDEQEEECQEDEDELEEWDGDDEADEDEISAEGETSAAEAAGGGEVAAAAESAAPAGPLRLALMGLPNAGKSTLMNRLLGMERSLTGPEPGLTRDAIKAPLAWKGMTLELTDTAGWMRKARLDQYDDVGGSVAAMTLSQGKRALAAVQVVALLLDAQRLSELGQVITHKELDLAGTALREGKALVVALNKIDTLTPKQQAAILEGLRAALNSRFLAAGQLPVVGMSAMEGAGVEALMDAVVDSYAKWNTKIPTSRLLRLLEKLQVRLMGGGPAAAVVKRIKFMAQVKARPPTFVAIMRGKSAVDEASERFLANACRQAFGLEGVPLRIHFRYNTKESKEKGKQQSHGRHTMLLHEWVADDNASQRATGQRAWSGNVEQFLREAPDEQEQQQQEQEEQEGPPAAPSRQHPRAKQPQQTQYGRQLHHQPPRSREGQQHSRASRGQGSSGRGATGRSPRQRHGESRGRTSSRGQPSSRGPANARGPRR